MFWLRSKWGWKLTYFSKFATLIAIYSPLGWARNKKWGCFGNRKPSLTNFVFRLKLSDFTFRSYKRLKFAKNHYIFFFFPLDFGIKTSFAVFHTAMLVKNCSDSTIKSTATYIQQVIFNICFCSFHQLVLIPKCNGEKKDEEKCNGFLQISDAYSS